MDLQHITNMVDCIYNIEKIWLLGFNNKKGGRPRLKKPAWIWSRGHLKTAKRYSNLCLKTRHGNSGRGQPSFKDFGTLADLKTTANLSFSSSHVKRVSSGPKPKAYPTTLQRYFTTSTIENNCDKKTQHNPSLLLLWALTF